MSGFDRVVHFPEDNSVINVAVALGGTSSYRFLVLGRHGGQWGGLHPLTRLQAAKLRDLLTAALAEDGERCAPQVMVEGPNV